MGYRIVNKGNAWKAAPGTKLYSVTTGRINPKNSASRRASRVWHKLWGLKTSAGNEKGTLWFFDSLKAAEYAKGRMKEVKIAYGEKIGLFEVSESGTIDFVKEVDLSTEA
jgi:hypothetical protein